MHKHKAIELLGGSITAAAEKVGVTYEAVYKWPDELPDRISDRVLAVLAREHLPPELIGADATPEVQAPELAQVATQVAHQSDALTQGA